MTTPPFQDDERKRLGRALAILRERAGLNQAQAAAAYAVIIGKEDFTPQAWGLYELGERKRIHDPEAQAQLAQAVGFSREDLLREANGALIGPRVIDLEHVRAAREAREEAKAFEIRVHGRAQHGPRGAHVYDLPEAERTLDLSRLYGPSTHALQLAGDLVYPWAASGTTIVYDRNQWPRRDQGCVIETLTGEYYVKIFDQADDETVYVHELHPKHRELQFRREELRGVYAVTDRID